MGVPQRWSALPGIVRPTAKRFGAAGTATPRTRGEPSSDAGRRVHVQPRSTQSRRRGHAHETLS